MRIVNRSLRTPFSVRSRVSHAVLGGAGRGPSPSRCWWDPVPRYVALRRAPRLPPARPGEAASGAPARGAPSARAPAPSGAAGEARRGRAPRRAYIVLPTTQLSRRLPTHQTFKPRSAKV